MNNEFILFSDIHFYKNSQLSTPDTEYITSWIRSQVEILHQIFSYASLNSIETIVFNGDLFEEKNRIDQAVYNLVWELFREYTEQGFRMIMNSGNHDLFAFSRNSSLKPFSSMVDVITVPTNLDVYPTEFKFIPYGMLEGNVDINSEFKYHVLFTHADIADLQYGKISKQSSSIIKPDIFNSWDLVMNGHIHRPQECGNIINIGSPMIQDWGESDEVKRFIHFSNGTCKSIPINCPNFYQLAGLSPRIIKSMEANDRDFFRVDISAEELSNPIFQKYNVSPHVVKRTKRELRLLDSGTDEDDIKRYLEIVDTNLDKGVLENIGREIIDEKI